MKKFMVMLLAVLFNLDLGYGQEVGAQAPDFTHNTFAHGTISLSDYQGKVVYLFFFGWD